MEIVSDLFVKMWMICLCCRPKTNRSVAIWSWNQGLSVIEPSTYWKGTHSCTHKHHPKATTTNLFLHLFTRPKTSHWPRLGFRLVHVAHLFCQRLASKRRLSVTPSAGTSRSDLRVSSQLLLQSPSMSLSRMR